MPKVGKTQKLVNFVEEKETIAALERLADEDNRSLAGEIRHIIKSYMKERALRDKEQG